MTSADESKTDNKLFGLKKEDAELLGMAASAIGLSILYNLLQESMFTSDAKKYTALITMMTSLTYAVWALLEFKQELSSKAKEKGTTPIGIIAGMRGTATDYMILGTLLSSGMYFTNWSLKYLTYTLRVLFKASKILPTVLIAVMVYGKTFGIQQYINIVILAVSIVLFSYGDAIGKGKTSNASFDVFGIVLISVGVLADALTSNFQEGTLFKVRKASKNEVMMAGSVFSALYMLAVMVASGKATDSFTYLMENPNLALKVVVSCSAGYFSISFILKIIKKAGAVTAEIVKSVRRVVSIVLSFIIYSKPFLSWHLIGSIFFLLFIYNTFMAKVKKQKLKKVTEKVQDIDLEELNKGMNKPTNGVKS